MPQDEFLLTYISFVTKKPEKLNPSPPNVSYHRISLFPGKVFNAMDHYLIAPPLDVMSGAKADVWLFPNFFRTPLVLSRRSVIVVHDLAFEDAPQFLVPRHREYMHRRVPQSVRQSSHVVAVSENTKRQLIKHYGTDPDKITVVEPALDQDKYKPAEAEAVTAVKKKYGITREYLLFVGTMDPRKNVAGLVRAYAALPDEVRQRYQLVLAGAPGRDWGWGYVDEEIDELEQSLGQDSIVRTGYFADADKPALMTGAKLFVWPSHYEGWGMPLLEAMACGTPTVTARNSSLSEAGGEAAAYVEQTDDPAELTELIQKLLDDDVRLAAMREAGIEHAKKFTWATSAQKLAGVLRSVGQKKR
jgi:glycosyltransferase involved in cell wall biosynthesis